MSDADSSENRPNEAASAGEAEASGGVEFADAEVAGESGAAAAAKPAEDPLAQAKADASRYREQLLRTAADFDNFRKRTRRELEDASRRGKEQALKELLPVFDNVERAIQSSVSAPDIKSVADGLRMVNRQFEGALDKLGIKRVPAVGHPFDPSLHEAIQHVDSTEHAAGVIANEVQPGYKLGDYLLRASLVVVSKGPGPSASATEAGGSEVGASESEAPAESTGGASTDAGPAKPSEPPAAESSSAEPEA